MHRVIAQKIMERGKRRLESANIYEKSINLKLGATLILMFGICYFDPILSYGNRHCCFAPSQTPHDYLRRLNKKPNLPS
jgi:hypothetical protein